MTGMHQAKILWFESLSDKKLDIGYAKQNLEDMKRIIETFEKNLRLLERVSSEKEKDLIQNEIKGMKEVFEVLKDRINVLEEEINSKNPEQGTINTLAGEIYWLFKEMLDYHVSAEKKLGIEPPPEPGR
jgi:chromosome segregation ATPase